ncbi:hypothetical protein A7E78_14075 [Syntrophotalea acetylenivorans]|uniref:Nucleotide modification associated domain-containing protein n=1 Tax=Syntrophotalea acetylenivorans TaxID=1842532 RepID=A0A1L3GSF5_9BACT|nr:hypothetical protein [Syntrophotalea acetylenivorans]APG28859.1 hypothetical protein A7E78_14075 [Syntrophotalea acetylenivorans]
MEIYSYVLKHDSGFAPNPFHGFLTLATCKPAIRRNARAGDILFGTGSKNTVGNNKLVYAAIVSKVVQITEYDINPKFEVKKPTINGEWYSKHGDNIYSVENAHWIQRRNPHHNRNDIKRDTSGSNVLICYEFWYFGKSAVTIPGHLQHIIKKGPGHKRISENKEIMQVSQWLHSLPKGINGTPEMEPNKLINRPENTSEKI